jgi:chemotaxis response regulator CheB
MNGGTPTRDGAPGLPLIDEGGGPSHIVGIGASAGGLEALEQFFEKMPARTGMAFIVVQHLSPDFKSLTDVLLARRTRIPIHCVENGMEVRPDAIYLIPPKMDMIVADGKLLLTDKDPTQLMTMPIDHFFRSVAQEVGDRSVGVILSGTGSDGSRGVREIHDAVGFVIAQTPETAQFDGMPILDNALGAVTGLVEVEAVWSQTVLEGRPALQVAIRDNGPGLSAEARENLFQPFNSTKPQGLGLGLATAKRVVEAHGGKIALGDGDRAGTEVVVTLPRGVG